MGNRNSVLIVDDDEVLRHTLSRELILTDKFIASEAGSSAEALEHIKSDPVDIILLDVDLPDMDGVEVCKLMRRRGFTNPVIMLTGYSSDAETILGLEAGANDYVTKPFRIPILLARIRAHLRYAKQSENMAFNLGNLKIDPAHKTLINRRGKRIHLTAMEASVLGFMCRSEGGFATKENLLNEVWGYNNSSIETHTVETHIYRLRRKLALNGGNARLVTENGGYRLLSVGDTEALEDIGPNA